MKKTLIALMALAGVAAAATEVDTISASYTNLVRKGECYADSFTFTFTLTDDYSLEESGAVLGFYRGSDPGNDYGYNAIVLGGSDDALTLTVGRGKASNTVNDATGISADTTFTFQDNYTFATTIQKGVEYTISFTLKEEPNQWGGIAGLLTPVLTWGDSGSESGTQYNGGMNGDAAFTVAVNSGTITIPEPTTATLSLLALAGLAARRRRK